jgi:hypothetical protein
VEGAPLSIPGSIDFAHKGIFYCDFAIDEFKVPPNRLSREKKQGCFLICLHVLRKMFKCSVT